MSIKQGKLLIHPDIFSDCEQTRDKPCSQVVLFASILLNTLPGDAGALCPWHWISYFELIHCNTCRIRFMIQHDKLRREAWDNLAVYFELDDVEWPVPIPCK